MRLTRPSHEFSPEAGLTRWYRTRSLGRRLVDQLTAQLSKDLEHIFGYYTVVTGPDIGLPFSQLGKTQRVFRLHSYEPSATGLGSVEGEANALPFATDSLDALVLCHTLDTTTAPHDVLRECQRVLVPNGHLIIISFNALSIWGCMNWARRLLPGKSGRIRGQGSRRLCDWLSLLGFATADPRFLASFSPRGRGRVGRLMDGIDKWLVSLNSPSGAVLVMHARKRVSQYLDSTSLVNQRPRLISIPLAKKQDGVPVPRELSRAQSEPLEPTP